MKSPHDMTSEQAIHWLNKTGKSIETFLANGGTMGSARAFELIDRYAELKANVYFRPDGSWKRYCSDNGIDESHNEYDLFA